MTNDALKAFERVMNDYNYGIVKNRTVKDHEFDIEAVVSSLKGQSKKSSLIESCINILIGYAVAIAAQLIIFPVFGINIPLHENLLIGAFFTIVSLIRSYFIRRLFNHLQVKKCPIL